jgi:hypothetical protein
VKLGIENRKQIIAASVLGVLLLLVGGYEFTTFSSTNASTTTVTTASLPQTSSTGGTRSPAHHGPGTAPGKKERAPQSLDPTLHLDQLAMSEEIKYEGSGRNIFVAQAEDIPLPLKNGRTDDEVKKDTVIQIPAQAPPPPIPLKFFGFANQPGEPRKVFLIKGEDNFIAGEGEIVDRRYKVVKISSASVEIQDLVVSGPPQSIPLTQEKP